VKKVRNSILRQIYSSFIRTLYQILHKDYKSAYFVTVATTVETTKKKEFNTCYLYIVY
jgi:hypothetical protein